MRDTADIATRDMLTGVFPILIGYTRISTRGQDPGNQEAQLRAAGCGKVFAEKITGTRRARLPLDHAYRLADESNMSMQEIATHLGIHRSTLFRLLSQRATKAK
ncbi:UNVERIFIED_ORG: DNA invertase Pin-like site-specific DNA recombinase [Burkholderia sp. 1263]